MSKADDSREGLAALFADVLSEGAPDPELLVRYADDPSALSPEERQMVESRLAESPQVRDQLKVLKRFDFPVEQPSEEKSNFGLAEALGRIRRLFESRPLLVGVPAIAVAALALLMIYPGAFSIAVTTPEYRAPEGAWPRFRSAPESRAYPPFRSATDPRNYPPGGYVQWLPHLIIVLAPEHIGQTASEAPSLYWYLSKIPESGGFEFWIGAVDAGFVPDQPNDTPAGEVSDTWIQIDLPSPNQPGLQRILLSDYGVELEAGVDYSWTISWTIALGPDAHAGGWIKRVELPASVAKRLDEGSLGEVPAIYAEAGLWYDALSSLLELVSDHPNNESLRTARLELLRQGGLEAVDEALAEHER
jgi:hypothetical protein